MTYEDLKARLIDAASEAQAQMNGHVDDLENVPEPPPGKFSYRDQPFPLEAFPPPLPDFLEQVAASKGSHIDMVAHFALNVLAGLIGTTRQVFPKADWPVCPRVFSCCVQESATGKTPTASALLAPARAIEHDLCRRHELEMQIWEETGDGKAASKPVRGRLLIADATREVLGTIMKENPRGLISYHDELIGWLNSFDAYRKGKGADRTFWLATHSGEPISVDRQSRPSIYVRDPFVNVFGSTQPSRVRDLIHEGEDGLAPRFLWNAPPPGYESAHAPPISLRLADEWARICRALSELGYDEDGWPVTVPFASGAQHRLLDYMDRIYEDRRDPGLPGSVKSVWGKMPGYLAVFCLVFAELHAVVTGGPEEVTPVLVDLAGKVADYYLNQALRIYEHQDIIPLASEYQRLGPEAENKLRHEVEKRGGKTTISVIHNSGLRIFRNASTDAILKVAYATRGLEVTKHMLPNGKTSILLEIRHGE
jgi:hypothetical protein